MYDPTVFDPGSLIVLQSLSDLLFGFLDQSCILIRVLNLWHTENFKLVSLDVQFAE